MHVRPLASLGASCTSCFRCNYKEHFILLSFPSLFLGMIQVSSLTDRMRCSHLSQAIAHVLPLACGTPTLHRHARIFGTRAFRLQSSTDGLYQKYLNGQVCMCQLNWFDASHIPRSCPQHRSMLGWTNDAADAESEWPGDQHSMGLQGRCCLAEFRCTNLELQQVLLAIYH
jgi:hypothetical protein